MIATMKQPKLGTVHEAKKTAIRKALDDNGQSRVMAAKALGVDITTLYRLIKKYEIPALRSTGFGPKEHATVGAKCCVCGVEIRRHRDSKRAYPYCGRSRCRERYKQGNSLQPQYRLAFAPSDPEGVAVYLEGLSREKFNAEWVALIVERFGREGEMRELANALLVVKQRHLLDPPQ